jgi:hypothetical protein
MFREQVNSCVRAHQNIKLLRFRSWVFSLFLSTCNFFFRVMLVLNKSAGARSVRESVEVSVCAWVSLVSAAVGVGYGWEE